MKRIIFTLVILFSVCFSAEASHISGGDIQYAYIGDSTGVKHQYIVYLRLYRDNSGVNLPNSANLSIRSSCYNNRTVLLPLVGGGNNAIDTTLFDCVEQSNLAKTLEYWIYQDTIVLEGKCSDWIFSWSSCCRPGGITNSNSGGYYFEAELNNFLGNNTSPFFVSSPATAFCTGQSYNWKQTALEPDGDSIFYKLIAPRTAATTDVVWQPGFSTQQPITTTPIQSLSMDPKSGIISFTPSAVEVDIMAVLVDEYRWDTVYGLWTHIGSSNRDMMVQIAGACKPLATAGVKLDYSRPDVYPDPDNGLQTVDYNCLDSSVTLYFASKMDCSTISADGTDFRLTAPWGQPIPVKEFVYTCDYNNETKQLVLKLHKPLSQNGKYWLYSKKGTDGNTLANKCGFAMPEFDTIQLNVEDCFKMQMDIQNVTIVDDLNPRVEWAHDTNSYPTYLYNKFKIFRQDPGGPYQHVGDVFDINKNYYVDNQVDWTMVDVNSYHYKVEMVLNGEDMGKTRDIRSIRLKKDETQCDTLNLEWNPYNGWGTPEYHVQIGIKQDNNTFSWSDHSHALSPANPTLDTMYTMYNPNLAQGDYKVRVITINTNGNLDTASSNWTDCAKIIPPPIDPEEIAIPNVFTPNGDGYNDYFHVGNITGYNTRRYVRIFNRWGKTVFESENYDNYTPGNVWYGEDKSGKELSDGVYFYSIELYDAPTAKKFSENGTVSLLRGQ